MIIIIIIIKYQITSPCGACVRLNVFYFISSQRGKYLLTKQALYVFIVIVGFMRLRIEVYSKYDFKHSGANWKWSSNLGVRRPNCLQGYPQEDEGITQL